MCFQLCLAWFGFFFFGNGEISVQSSSIAYNMKGQDPSVYCNTALPRKTIETRKEAMVILLLRLQHPPPHPPRPPASIDTRYIRSPLITRGGIPHEKYDIVL